MQVSVLQENLQKGLSIVGRAVPSKPSMPILSNILISTEDQRLKLSATNLELGITAWIGAKIQTEGAITVPGKTLSELVSNLSPERVDLELNTRSQILHLTCGGFTGNIKCVDANEFPIMQTADPQDGVIIPAALFKEMVSHVDFAAAKEDNRPVLTGVFTHFEDNEVTMASADGYRLAVRTASLEVPVSDPFDIIIPSRTLSEVAKIIGPEDEDVAISLPTGRNQVIFQLANVEISSSLIEGTFPDYQAIIPKGHTTVTQLYTADFLKACKRSEVFAKDSANSAKIIVKPNPNGVGRVMVTSRSQEKGDNEGVVDANADGDEIEISFNIKYMIEVLNVINEDEIVLEMSGSTSPGLLRPVGREDYIHVIMPMSVNR